MRKSRPTGSLDQLRYPSEIGVPRLRGQRGWSSGTGCVSFALENYYTPDSAQHFDFCTTLNLYSLQKWPQRPSSALFALPQSRSSPRAPFPSAASRQLLLQDQPLLLSLKRPSHPHSSHAVSRPLTLLAQKRKYLVCSCCGQSGAQANTSTERADWPTSKLQVRTNEN